MPKRRSVQPDTARGTILAAATRVFAKRGIDDTRVEDILTAANVARRTFYKYFSSKEDVLAALYEATTSELVRAIEAMRARDDGEPLDAIHRGIDLYLDFHRSVPHLRELIELGMKSSSQLAPLRKKLRDAIVLNIDRAVQKLDGRKLDPLVYYGLMSALEGLSLEILDAGATPAVIGRARKVVHALLDQTLGVSGGHKLP